MDKKDPVYDSFNLKPIEKPIELVPIDKSNGDRVIDDIDEARTSTKNLIEIGESALQDLKALSGVSEDMKTYAELSKLIKVLVDANESLVNTAKERDDIVNRDGKVADQTINNNLFVGSTTDAIKLLKEKREQEENNND
jgi:hypothetical protein